ncbi:MAG: hypothetical protein JSS82_00280 [Bacteroidetes bacterium]|nr:hypothetical protein [Bacteroidota bacterium]
MSSKKTLISAKSTEKIIVVLSDNPVGCFALLQQFGPALLMVIPVLVDWEDAFRNDEFEETTAQVLLYTDLSGDQLGRVLYSLGHSMYRMVSERIVCNEEGHFVTEPFAVNRIPYHNLPVRQCDAPRKYIGLVGGVATEPLHENLPEDRDNLITLYNLHLSMNGTPLCQDVWKEIGVAFEGSNTASMGCPVLVRAHTRFATVPIASPQSDEQFLEMFIEMYSILADLKRSVNLTAGGAGVLVVTIEESLPLTAAWMFNAALTRAFVGVHDDCYKLPVNHVRGSLFSMKIIFCHQGQYAAIDSGSFELSGCPESF